MVILQMTIHNEVGLHARPASLFVQCANRFNSNITIRKINPQTGKVNAKSILHVLTLGVHQGEGIELMIDGADEEDAAATIKHFFEEELPRS